MLHNLQGIEIDLSVQNAMLISCLYQVVAKTTPDYLLKQLTFFNN